MVRLPSTQLQAKIKQHPYVQDSIKMVRRHGGARHLLGDKIKHHNANLAQKSENFVTSEEARFKIGVTGEKGEGWLVVKALAQDGGEMSLSRCELELVSTSALEPDQYRDKRLVIFDTHRHGSVAEVLAGRGG